MLSLILSVLCSDLAEVGVPGTSAGLVSAKMRELTHWIKTEDKA